MKKVSIQVCLIMASTVFMLSCQKSNKLIINNYALNEVIDEEKIINDVEKSLSALSDGVMEKDAEKIFSIFKDKKESLYIREGSIYPSVSKAEKNYADAFKYSNDSIQRNFVFTHKNFDILNSNTVLLTAIGEISKENTDDAPWVIAYTILWINTEEGWKAVNMHISWKDKKKKEN